MKYLKNINKIEMCITSKCNLFCKHCYQHFEKNQFCLSKNKIFEIIDYVRSKHCSNVILSGGEIFTRDDIYDIIDYILKSDLKLLLVTNATLIDIEKIKQFSKNNLSFQVSIDGCETEHDKRRGSGMYNITISNVKRLRKLGFYVKGNVTLDNDNYKDVLDLLEAEDFDEITFLPVANAGAATIFKKEQTAEFEDVIRELYLHNSKIYGKNHRCNIFPKGLSINYDGIIYPCSIARDYKLFPVGNVNNENIEVIIKKFLNSEKSDCFFEYLGNDQVEKCRSCSKKNKCNQGCRIRAYKMNASLFEPDPFCCKLYKYEYKDVSISDIYWGNRNE